MILDTIERGEAYMSVHPGITSALRALRDPALLAREDGRFPLDGDRLVAIVQRYETRPSDQCVWEAHRHVIDVQCVVEGIEAMGHLPISRAKPSGDYDAERDVQFFEPPFHPDRASRLLVGAGSFAVFFPDDVHCPGLTVDGKPGLVKKIVVKVAVDW